MKKLLSRLSLILFIAISLSWTAYFRTDGFHPSKIEGLLPSVTECTSTSEVQQIFLQPFHYLGKGRQCFVFESGDGRYVLKFFNKTYFQMPWHSFFNFEKEKRKREKRRSFFESSYAIAYREFGEEILHLHLGPSDDLPILILQGPAHNSFQMDLNRISFVLQKKGRPFYDELEAIYVREGIPGLQREIDAFAKQVSSRIAKRIADDDSDVEHNWGYLDGKIFHLDPGRLYCDPTLSSPDRQKEEWNSATFRFVRWLKAHYPEAARYLENQLPAN